ncbi:hypothetical protein [uncultured Tenacibaculum sp.]|uniref:hypothetical protein n=1 Tax=uncultured Tenacibaculum sp. TaxID=174713 RepID=UPI00262D152F|nr:hypothetical protein [uncultured Tenacibaculum sp.]
MKKLVALFLLMFTVSTTLVAQKKQKDELSIDQKTELKLKKMTLKLDLTPKQQRQIRPLLAQSVSDHMAMREKRKAMKAKGQELSSEQRYELKSKMLDKQIAIKQEMKQILNEQQYERFEKSLSRRVQKGKKRLKKHKKKKHSERSKDEW